MNRTTVMLPEDLKMRAVRSAHAHGLSLGQFIRESLENKLKRSLSKDHDSFWSDTAFFEGRSPKDTAKNHDQYLYGDAG